MSHQAINALDVLLRCTLETLIGVAFVDSVAALGCVSRRLATAVIAIAQLHLTRSAWYNTVRFPPCFSPLRQSIGAARLLRTTYLVITSDKIMQRFNLMQAITEEILARRQHLTSNYSLGFRSCFKFNIIDQWQPYFIVRHASFEIQIDLPPHCYAPWPTSDMAEVHLGTPIDFNMLHSFLEARETLRSIN